MNPAGRQMPGGLREGGVQQNWIRWENGLPEVQPRVQHWSALASATDLEFHLTSIGAKPAAKLEDLSPARLERYVASAGEAGLDVAIVPLDSGPGPGERGLAAPETSDVSMLFAATNREVLRHLLEAEKKERRGGSRRAASQAVSGRLLGYPHCCTTRFTQLASQNDSTVMTDFASMGKGALRAIHPVLNFFPPLVSPVTWYPCTFDCRFSLETGLEMMAALQAKAGARTAAIRSALPGLTLVFGRFCFVHLHAPKREAGGISFQSVSDALSFVAPDSRLHDGPAGRFRAEVAEPLAVCSHLAVQGRRVVASDGHSQFCGELESPLFSVEFPPWELDGGAA